jgi:FkbM family methyltransferase
VTTEIDFYGFKFGQDKARSSTVPEMLEVFKLLRPKPSAHPLMRIGGNRDGSYLVPDDLRGITACFSPGVNNFKYFEDFLVENYDIDCHMCDFSSDVSEFKTPLIEGKQTFLKKWLDNNSDADSISLDAWVKEKAPDGDLLLQIDIEGAEYRNLLSVSDEVLSRFRIIVIEVHDMFAIGNPGILRDVLAPFFRRLHSFFNVVHAHPNNCCGEFNIPGTEVSIPNVLELTYLRKDRVAETSYPSLIPHPLDVSRNVPQLPPMFLGENWLDGPRAVESKLKMLEDRFEDHVRIAQLRPARMSVEQGKLIGRSLQTLTERMNALANKGGKSDDLAEAAKGKKYVVSSAYEGTQKTGTVDQKANYFFHTQIGVNEFIRVDLEKQLAVSKIVISNRLDNCFDRARTLFVIISPTSDHKKGEVFSVPVSKGFLNGEETSCEMTIPQSQGRFVTIISPVETALHFSDLQIFVKL